ncbi:Protein K10H10.12 [Aphelenchoides avenae]|nr:Protein K10H10.12 [Aphelenchus avenae]
MTKTLLVLAILLGIASVVDGELWCHQGGAERDYRPVQCPPTSNECYKMTCYGGQSPFVSRGCGSPVRLGVRNESCLQAQEMCQMMRGNAECLTCNNKHLCNDAPNGLRAPLTIMVICILSLSFGQGN